MILFPIIIRNKTYGPAMKIFMAALIKAGTWAIMRYLRGLSKDLFNGQVPEDIVERYSRKRSVSRDAISALISSIFCVSLSSSRYYCYLYLLFFRF